MARRGRKPQFTRAEITHMRELYNDPKRAFSAADIARLYRCSETYVLKAVEGKVSAKDER
jgi:hypothetical protein